MTHLPDNRQAKVVFESKDFCQRLRRIGNLVGRDRVFVGTVAFGKPDEDYSVLRCVEIKFRTPHPSTHRSPRI